ncbi:MAG: GIY-YIG nuclease family protein [Pirellulaceae bacterium]|nr:GIY-YIG nuclease family protein [Pirellulaceae bacterium]
MSTMLYDLEADQTTQAVAVPEFTGLGVSKILDVAVGESQLVELPQDLSEARKLLREVCPRTPGVYGWLNGDQQIVYVGKSKSLRHRILSYFAKVPADPKMGRIRRASVRLIWEPIPHELLALLREQELIHHWRPEYNSQGQPLRRQPAFVCLSDSAASHALVAKRLTGKAQSVFGPIMGTNYLQESVESLNHVFKLRDCSDKTKFEFSSQLRLFEEASRAKCIRHELGSCPGPCASLCSVNDYRDNLQRAQVFLQGNDKTTLKDLEAQMLVAGKQRNFERAAILRNHWQALGRLDRQLNRLRTSQARINGVLITPLSKGRNLWAIFRHGVLHEAMAEPRSAGQAERLQTAIQSAFKSQPTPTSDILAINLKMIVHSWFGKYRDELGRLQTLESALETCEQIAVRYQRRAAS